MFKKILFFLLATEVFSCPDESFSWQNKCFFFQNQSAGFADAESKCVAFGGHLASIHDGFINALLAQKSEAYFHESTVTNFWIGLTNLIAFGNWTWMDGSATDFTEWNPSIQQNLTDSNCVGVSPSKGKWDAMDCFKLQPYVCQVDKNVFEPTTTTRFLSNANCTFPFTYFGPTHSCYGNIHWTAISTWTEAEQYCETWGGHLTSIHSDDESRLLGAMSEVANYDLWSGAFSNDGGKTWQWSDRTPWDYNVWIGGYPNKNASACGAINGAGHLHDENCGSHDYRFVCKVIL